MAASDKLKNLVDAMPGADGNNDGGKKGRRRSKGTLTGPKWSDITPVFDAILKGGSENIVGIVSMLAPTDEGKDIKARYTLHAVLTYACTPGKDEERACVAGAIASQLAGQSKDNQAFLMRELQLCADAKTAPELGKYLCTKDLSTSAAYALTAIGADALPQFRAALPKAKGSCLLDVVQALGVEDGADVLGHEVHSQHHHPLGAGLEHCDGLVGHGQGVGDRGVGPGRGREHALQLGVHVEVGGHGGAGGFEQRRQLVHGHWVGQQVLRLGLGVGAAGFEAGSADAKSWKLALAG